ncbi:MAG: glycoside hydrolase family 88 protein [Casimicrobiaceae bacterium]
MNVNALTKKQTQLFNEALDLLALKIAEDESTIGIEFPHVTSPDGRWETYPASWSAGYLGDAWSHGHWTCGFWVGLLVAAHLHTGEGKYLEWARERMRLVAQRAVDANTHDIGFIFDGSAIPAHYVTGDAWYANIALTAANQLRARLVPTRDGAYLSSWGPLSDQRARCSSAIDTMANLPLLYWAARHTGDGSFLHAAEAHARKTSNAFIRPDMSTYHAVTYDAISGARLRGYTFQGFNDESMWSRGQAWAIYGYATTARETRDPAYMRQAELLADHYLRRLGGAIVPPWDFDDPSAPKTNEDSATAAIVSSAFLEIALLQPEGEASHRWRQRAVTMLEGLCEHYLAREPAHRGLLLHSCYSRPHGQGVDAATMFGDFYFVEAICKITMPGRFRPQPRLL